MVALTIGNVSRYSRKDESALYRPLKDLSAQTAVKALHAAAMSRTLHHCPNLTPRCPSLANRP